MMAVDTAVPAAQAMPGFAQATARRVSLARGDVPPTPSSDTDTASPVEAAAPVFRAPKGGGGAARRPLTGADVATPGHPLGAAAVARTEEPMCIRP